MYKIAFVIYLLFNLFKKFFSETNESRRKTENFQRFIELCYDIEDLPVK